MGIEKQPDINENKDAQASGLDADKASTQANKQASVPSQVQAEQVQQVEALPQTPGTTSLYSSADESNNMANLEELGFKTTIKQQKNAKNTEVLDPKNIQDTVVASVMDTADQKQTQEPVLEKLESFQDDLNLDLIIEREYARKAKYAKLTFAVLLVITIVLGGWYFTDAKEMLGYTSLKQSSAQTTQAALKSAKLDLAYANYYQAATKSQNLSYLAVAYHKNFILSNNQYTPRNAQAQAKSNLQQLETQIKAELDSMVLHMRTARKTLDSDKLKVALISRLDDSQLQASTASTLAQAGYEGEFLGAEQLSRELGNLATNPDLSAYVLSTDYKELSQKQLLEYLINLFELYEGSQLKRLSLLSLNRSFFTTVLGELAAVTKQFDETFNVFDTRENFTIRHTGYSFNADNSQISVNSEIQTVNPQTFSLVADLEDAILQNPMFSGLNVSNYSKSQIKDSGLYGSNLLLEFDFNKL